MIRDAERNAARCRNREHIGIAVVLARERDGAAVRRENRRRLNAHAHGEPGRLSARRGTVHKSPAYPKRSGPCSAPGAERCAALEPPVRHSSPPPPHKPTPASTSPHKQFYESQPSRAPRQICRNLTRSRRPTIPVILSDRTLSNAKRKGVESLSCATPKGLWLPGCRHCWGQRGCSNVISMDFSMLKLQMLILRKYARGLHGQSSSERDPPCRGSV